MSQEKLIKQLKEKNPNLSQTKLKNILNLFVVSIKQALKNGQEIEIRNFGSFRLSKLKASAYLRNPSTNELIYRPERVKVRFKASKKLNKIINK